MKKATIHHIYQRFIKFLMKFILLGSILMGCFLADRAKAQVPFEMQSKQKIVFPRELWRREFYGELLEGTRYIGDLKGREYNSRLRVGKDLTASTSFWLGAKWSGMKPADVSASQSVSDAYLFAQLNWHLNENFFAYLEGQEGRYESINPIEFSLGGNNQKIQGDGRLGILWQDQSLVTWLPSSDKAKAEFESYGNVFWSDRLGKYFGDGFLRAQYSNQLNHYFGVAPFVEVQAHSNSPYFLSEELDLGVRLTLSSAKLKSAPYFGIWTSHLFIYQSPWKELNARAVQDTVTGDWNGLFVLAGDF